MAIKVVSFDFDGVFVLDSDAVFKKEAWGIVFEGYGEGRYRPLLDEGNRRYGSGKPGGRVEIMAYVFAGLGKPEMEIPGLVEEAAKVFDNHVQARILEAGLVSGTREALEELRRRGLSLYLNSGTATRALELSARNLNISQFFGGIFGSTRGKTDNLRTMSERESVGPQEILVVGDGDSDRVAAEEFGAPFLGVANRWNKWANTKKEFPLIDHLSQVCQFV